MIKIKPVTQTKIYGFDFHLLELVRLYKENIYPNKLLLSGLKGIGKYTLANHFINYVLSVGDDNEYNLKKREINPNSSTFKTILNKSNPNVTIVDVSPDKKFIDINQIRDLILNLNKSSFNNKPRFVLIDNVELLNINSINALLKILEEPSKNINFILINSNKKILPTLSSRCVNFKIYLTNKECLDIINKILNQKLETLINLDFINYYFTPGNIYNLIRFAHQEGYDLIELDLKSFLKLMIKENYYKKDKFIKYIIFDLCELYFNKLNSSFSIKLYEKYKYFLKRVSETKNFNLDEETFFMEFKEKVFNE